jgi:hypothetical protein
LQKLQCLAGNQAIFLGIPLGTPFARQGIVPVRKLAAESLMGIVGHPFVPYVLVLLGLLRSL